MSKVFYIVHHCGTTSLNVMGQLAYIGCLRTVYCQQIKKLFNLCKVLQFYLLDEKDVHFGHHVHGLQKVFREISVFQKEWIETVVNIILEIFHRTNLWQDGLDDMFMVIQNFIQRISAEVIF